MFINCWPVVFKFYFKLNFYKLRVATFRLRTTVNLEDFLNSLFCYSTCCCHQMVLRIALGIYVLYFYWPCSCMPLGLQLSLAGMQNRPSNSQFSFNGCLLGFLFCYLSGNVRRTTGILSFHLITFTLTNFTYY